MAVKTKCLILTSGGDAPGMNATIRAIVRTAHCHDIETYASLNGYDGLVNNRCFQLYPENVANMIQRGGTILKSDRCKDFFSRDTRDKCRDYLQSENIKYVIVIGGDGSFRGASLLETESTNGPKTIGIPATIDNDIHGTEYTIGYDTARNTALQAIDHIRDTASSHDRNFLVEVMGRSAGFLALEVGIAGGAEYVLTPEFPVSIADLAKTITAPRRRKLSSIIVVAEGNQPGRSISIARELEHLTNLQYRVCILGHTQRGGNPTALDRLIASQMGAKAVEALLENKSNKMIAMQNHQIVTADFPEPTRPARSVDSPDLLNLAQMLST